MARSVVVGVDVGGTNTDACLVDVDLAEKDAAGSVLAAFKSPTTARTTEGIIASVHHVLTSTPHVGPADIVAVNIGTTHFINAVVERDAQKLVPVAVLRLCGPYAREVPPFAGFPARLRAIIEGYTAYLSGGVEIDGRLIASVDEDEVRRVARVLRHKDILNVAIVGIYSPIDTQYHQEDEVKRILVEELGSGANITLSRQIAQIGFLERENASILNAAILPLARKTIGQFRNAFKKLDLNVPLFLTQNDGTLITAQQASELPIRTFLSGPTNSLAGAAFLAGVGRELNKQVLMVDIGGTTSDVCALLPSGFPRQAAAFSELAGVRTNFPLPDICSIGVGGGSLVRRSEDGKVEVGPESVGRQLETRSLVFGGDQLTATDIVVASGEKSIGVPKHVQHLTKDLVTDATAEVKRLLDRVVDRMKTSSDPLKVILVGGGSIIAPKELKGVSELIHPPHANCANAVGAAIAKVSATIDTIRVIEGTTERKVLEDVVEEALEAARNSGALNPSLLEQSAIPVPYMSTPTIRVIVRVAGRLSPEKLKLLKKSDASQIDPTTFTDRARTLDSAVFTNTEETSDVDILTYEPTIKDRLWKLSRTDVNFISAGSGVLGAGGGGDPHASSLSVTALLESGSSIFVTDPADVKSDGVVSSFGYMGSPNVFSERIPSGKELRDSAVGAMQAQSGSLDDLAAVMSLEIGGSNGLRGLQVAGWLNKPVVDADLMGRAYPNLWQISPTNADIIITPAAISDAKGSTLVQTAATDNKAVETMLRGLCVQMGHAAGICLGAMTGAQVQAHAVQHSISLAWRLGRCIEVSKLTKQNAITSILSVYPGKLIFSGKIIDVHRQVVSGFLKGSLTIAPNSPAEDDATNGFDTPTDDNLVLDFQNENIRAYTRSDSARETTLAIVPDIITVLDAQDGSALGTQDYRYGLRVNVIALVGSPQWTKGKGLENGGPKAFNLDVPYVPVARYKSVRSVIEEFGGGK